MEQEEAVEMKMEMTWRKKGEEVGTSSGQGREVTVQIGMETAHLIQIQTLLL